MGKYLFTASYTADGIGGLLADGGTGRKAAVEALTASVGGSLESMYFMFGKHDLVAIVDLPDDKTAAAVAITIGASGAVDLRTEVLLTPEQVDAATKMSPAYTPPGG